MISKRIIQIGELTFPSTCNVTMETTETQQILESQVKNGGVPLNTRLASQEILIQGTFDSEGIQRHLPHKNGRRVYLRKEFFDELQKLKQKVWRAFCIGDDNRIYSSMVKVSVPRKINEGVSWKDFELQCFNYQLYWEDVTECVFWEVYLENGLQTKLFRYDNECAYNKYYVQPFLLRYLEPPYGIGADFYSIIERTIQNEIETPVFGPVTEEGSLDGDSEEFLLDGEDEDYSLLVNENYQEFTLDGDTEEFTLDGDTEEFLLEGSNSTIGQGDIIGSVINTETLVTQTEVDYLLAVDVQAQLTNVTGKLAVYIVAIFPEVSELNTLSIEHRKYTLGEFTHLVINSRGAFVGTSLRNLKQLDALSNIFDAQVPVVYSGISNPVVKYIAHTLTL